MKTLQKNNSSNLIEQFAELVNAGVEAWVKAGEIVAGGVDADEDFIEKLCAAHPEFSPDLVRRFEQIGRRLVHPKLMLADAPGYRRLRRLGYPIQEKCLERGVEVLVNAGTGWDTLNAEVLNLTSEQAQQVFAHNHVRSTAEQRAYIESQAMLRYAPKAVGEPYFRITGKKLITLEARTWSARELAGILAQLEA